MRVCRIDAAMRVAGVGLCLAGGMAPAAAAQSLADDAVARMESNADGRLRVERSHDGGLARFVSVTGGRGVPGEVAASASPEEQARAFLARYGRAFGIARAAELEILHVSAADALGMHHVRLQQTHAGLKVAGAQLIVHLRGGNVVAANGRTIDAQTLDSVGTAPAIAADEAASKARERVVRERNEAPIAVSSPVLELLSRDLLEGRSGPVRLAWFTKVHARRVLEYVWIDAATGEILLSFNQQPDARDRRIHTAAHTYELPGMLARSEGAPPGSDAEVDAAYDFAGDSYDFFWSHFGRDSLDGAGQPLVVTVHYGHSYPNAFWDPDTERIALGDGGARDDVVGHEITHGLTQHTADLYYYSQSGALNESISDIFGETIDLLNGAGDDSPGVRWLVGEDWHGLGPFRNMMDPTRFGHPGKLSDPELYCGSGDQAGVHTNSGILNHAYALAVDGGAYNGRTIAGIGLAKASAVVYRALTVYLTPTSSFADAESALRLSCQDLIASAQLQPADCDGFGQALEAVELGEPGFCFRPITVVKQGSSTGTVTSDPPGISCGPTCAALFDVHSVVHLTATPDAGAMFSGWSGACSGLGDCMVLPVDSLTVMAAFDQQGTLYPVVVTLDGPGTVSSSPEGILCGPGGGECAADFPAGTEVTLTATAPVDWWPAWGGDCSGHGTTCNLVMSGGRNVSVDFTEAAFIEASAFQAFEYGFEWGRPAWGDYDNDGDLDLVITGQSQYMQQTKLYRNEGGSFVRAGISLIQVDGSAAWGDYDNDGDLDLVLSGYAGVAYGIVTQLYRNDSGTLAPVPTPIVAAGVAAAWGDYDNDGDLDLAIGDYYGTRLYRNDRGTFVNSGARLSGTKDLAWGDYDRDGDLDLVAAGRGPTSPTVLHRNDHGVLTEHDYLPPARSVAWADYDADGDLDLALVGEELKVFWNDAGVLADSGLSLLRGLDWYRGAVSWGDYDGDGDPDLLVTGELWPWPVTRLYRNDGGVLTDVFTGLRDVTSGAAWADYDDDGRLDLVLVGTFGPDGAGSSLAVFRNATSPNTPPAPPGSPAATTDWDGVALSWTSEGDQATPADALSFNVRVGTTAAGSEVVSAMADDSTGWRRLVAPGNAGESTRLVLKGLEPGEYYWSVQAIDTSFAGSAFTEGPPFTVTNPSLSFHTVTPCRLLDTRQAPGTYGGPALLAGRARAFPAAGRCGIPATARAVSTNLTVTQPTKPGHLAVYRGGGPPGSASSINYSAAQTRANNAVVALNGAGELAVQCVQADGSVHLVVDVNGYFE